MSPVGDDTATTSCGMCGRSFIPLGRQQWCSTECRQAVWRRRRAVPRPAVPTKATTVYECDACGQRYLGDQRCDECNTWCRRIGPGGACPHCDEPVSVIDLIGGADRPTIAAAKRTATLTTTLPMRFTP